MSANLNSFAFSLNAALLFGLKEINRNNLFCDHFSHCRYLLMLRMIGVMVQSRSVGKMRDKSGVVRAFEMQNVGADFEARNALYHGRQGSQFCPVLVAFFLSNFRFVFPADYMNQHIILSRMQKRI